MVWAGKGLQHMSRSLTYVNGAAGGTIRNGVVPLSPPDVGTVLGGTTQMFVVSSSMEVRLSPQVAVIVAVDTTLTLMLVQSGLDPHPLVARLLRSLPPIPLCHPHSAQPLFHHVTPGTQKPLLQVPRSMPTLHLQLWTTHQDQPRLLPPILRLWQPPPQGIVPVLPCWLHCRRKLQIWPPLLQPSLQHATSASVPLKLSSFLPSRLPPPQ